MKQRVLVFALAFVIAGCGSDGGVETDSGATGLTYYKDVKPIIDAKCATCHVEGGVAPFALTSYALVKPQAGVAMLALQDGTMPPWKANRDCNEYHGDFSLTDTQQQTIIDWVLADAPEGDPNNEGQALPDTRETLSRVDETLSMAQPYTPQLSPDDYRCFLIPWPEKFTSTKYVTGFRAAPGNFKVVHHVIAYLAAPNEVSTYEDLDAQESGPGFTCFGGSGGPAQQWIGGWAPGNLGSDFPAGTGIAVEPGSMIVLQVHYNTTAGEISPDATSIEVKLDDSVDNGRQDTAVDQPRVGWQQVHAHSGRRARRDA